MNSRAVETNPRKRPRQTRSTITVNAMYAAAAHILIEQGDQRITTARVAERAGVSIGSLYQYFPNKKALIAGLIERHADDIVTTIRAALERSTNRTLEDALRAVVSASVSIHRSEFHHILHNQVPKVGRLTKRIEIGRQIATALERHLRAHVTEMHPGRDPAVAAVIIEAAIASVGHKLVTERPNLLPEGLIERELFDLVAAYVLPYRRKRVG